MNIKDIGELINLIPNLIIYIAPGYISILTQSFLHSRKVDDAEALIFKSIVLSYFIINIEKEIFRFFNFIMGRDFLVFYGNSSGTILLTIAFSVVLVYIWFEISSSKLFEKTMLKLGVFVSIHDNVFENILNKNEGAWATLYISDEAITYIGILRYYEQKNNKDDFYVALSNYSSYDNNTNEICNYSDVDTEWVVINAKTVSRIEIKNKPRIENPSEEKHNTRKSHTGKIKLNT